MAVDPAELKASFEAQSVLNTSALAAFDAIYPLIVVGHQFTDTNGLKWEITAKYATKNYPVVIKTWIDDTDTLSNYSTMLVNFSGIYETYTYPLVLTTQPGGQEILIEEAAYGIALGVSIDGFDLTGSQYDWNATTRKLTLTDPTTDGQNLIFTYKKRPYYYGYP